MSLLRCRAGTGHDVQPMRRLVAIAAAAAALCAVSPAAAARTGTIEGRVVNATTGRPQQGVEVTLTSGGDVRSFEDTVVTGRDGRYRFDGLRTGEDRFYVLDAVYKDGLFAGRPITLPADTRQEPVIESTLRVFEPTTDPNAILIRRNNLFVVHEDDRLSIVESVKVVNPTNNAYIGRGSALDASSGDDDERSPSLGFALPDGLIPESFRWLEADVDVPEAVELQGVGFGITTAIPPGEVDFTFTYQVRGEGGTFDLSRRALYEVTEINVFAADPLSVETNRLEQGDTETIGGTPYDRFTTTEPAGAADPIQILIVAEAGASLPLIAGAGVGLALLVLIAVAAFKRTRRHPERAKAPHAPEREQLIAAIAELDLRHESGDVPRDQYAARRDELKRRLNDLSASGAS